MTNKEISDVIIEYREALWKKLEIKTTWGRNEIKEHIMLAEIEVLRKYFINESKKESKESDVSAEDLHKNPYHY